MNRIQLHKQSKSIGVLIQKQRRLSMHKRNESVSSMQRKQLNKTKRVNSINKIVNSNKPITLIQTVKTTRISTTTDHNNNNSNNGNSNDHYYSSMIMSKTSHTKNTNNNINKTINKPISSSPKLTTIPILSNPEQITQLDYSNNKITTIPKNIHSTYTKLTILKLSFNEITSIQPLCLITSIKQIYLQSNLVNFIPKQIKNLIKLQYLNLKSNKLWYISQIVALKQLLKVRHQQIGQQCVIQLDGNGVLGTNKVSVQKLLHVEVNTNVNAKNKINNSNNDNNDNLNKQNHKKDIIQQHTHKKHQNNTKNIIQQQSPSQYKQNTNPNQMAHITNNNNNKKSTLSKHTKSKSLNQSLQDMSAIIANIPISSTKTTNQYQCQIKQNNCFSMKDLSLINRKKLSSIYLSQGLNNQLKNNQKSFVKHVNNKNKFNKTQNINFPNQLSVRQIISQQLTKKVVAQSQFLIMQDDDVMINSTHDENNNNLCQQQQKQSLKIEKYSYYRLFSNVVNFSQQIINPSIYLLKQLNDIQKKLTLAVKINGIHESIKTKFIQLNQHVITSIKQTKIILQQLSSFNINNNNTITTSTTTQNNKKIDNNNKNNIKFINNNQIKQFSQNLINYLNVKKQQYQQQISKGSVNQINEFHQFIVNYYLNSNQQNHLKWYQVWLNQYQHLQKLENHVQTIFLKYLNIWKKVQKLVKVTSMLYPTINTIKQKNNSQQQQKQSTKKPFIIENIPPNNLHSIGSQSKKSTQRKQLNKLLFSQTKQKRVSLFCSQKKQSLLLSGKTDYRNNANRSSSRSPQMTNRKVQKDQQQQYHLLLEKNNKKDKKSPLEYCLQCPLRQQQILTIQHQLTNQKQKTQNLQQQINQLKQTILQLKTIDNQYKQIIKNQQQIIQQIYTIKPSTYQNLLLQQALSIQDLIQQKNFVTEKYKSNLMSNNINNNNAIQFLLQENNYHNQKQNQYYRRALLNDDDKKYSNQKNNRFQSNCEKHHKNRPKTQLNENLLTQQSTKSNQNKSKSVQRTYFKSNGTAPVSQSTHMKIQGKSNEQQCRTSLSNKNRPFSIQSKPNPSISSQHHHNSSQNRNSFQSRQSPLQHQSRPFRNETQTSQKNQIFEKIIVAEFMNEMKTSQQNDNLNKQSNQIINQKNDALLLQENQRTRELINSNLIYNNSNFYHSKNTQQITFIQNHTLPSPIQKNSLIKNQNNKILQHNPRKNSDLHLESNKLPYPDGYNYETINLHEKHDYKHYIKYHLRNNIKLLLDQKYQSYDDNNCFGNNKLLNKQGNFSNDKKRTNMIIDPCKILKQGRNKVKREVKSLSCQKLHSAGKYIRKSGDTHGK